MSAESSWTLPDFPASLDTAIQSCRSTEHDIYIAHHPSQNHLAQEVTKHMEDHNLTCFLPCRNLPAGVSLVAATEYAIKVLHNVGCSLNYI